MEEGFAGSSKEEEANYHHHRQSSTSTMSVNASGRYARRQSLLSCMLGLSALLLLCSHHVLAEEQGDKITIEIGEDADNPAYWSDPIITPKQVSNYRERQEERRGKAPLMCLPPQSFANVIT